MRGEEGERKKKNPRRERRRDEAIRSPPSPPPPPSALEAAAAASPGSLGGGGGARATNAQHELKEVYAMRIVSCHHPTLKTQQPNSEEPPSNWEGKQAEINH
uniref:Uncharacterized protein n=1 Tax=Oryza glumipatula TaxID=40148 RepID=A0A0E0A479_9ORYZ